MPRNYFAFTALLLLSLFFSQALNAQVVVTATAGTPGPTAYSTLKASFDAINSGTHQGNINISIRGNTTESAQAVLNASGNGSASYTGVQIKPDGVYTISGSIANGPLLRLNGSGNVIIDGSSGAGNTRDLTITNISGTSGNVIVLGSVGTIPVNNVTLKNTILINGTQSSTAMIVGDATTPGNPGYFSNITIQNNDFRKAYIGLYMYAVISALINNVNVTGNDLNATGADAIRMVGIYGQGMKGLTISNNNIGNFESGNAEFDRAIWLATATTNTTISQNTISGLNYTGSSSYAPIGISVSSGVTNANIIVENNTVENLASSGTGTTNGMFIYSVHSGITIRNNRVHNIQNTNATGYGAAGILLAATLSNSATKVYNNFVWDVTGYGFNGVSSNDNGNGIVVDGGGGYEIDFNTVVQNANPASTGAHKSACMLISSNVTAAGSITMRSNIFVNQQNTGNLNSAPAIAIGANSNVLGTVDYNIYYSLKGNIASNGTANALTLAGLQTMLGGNINSMIDQPVFVGANDLHLAPAGNMLINNKGTPIGGITTDIDGDGRSATTPDPGADEFTVCPVITINTQPTAPSICASQNTSITVAATNATNFQWQVDDGTGAGFTNITNNAVYSGATLATLNVTNVPAGYNGYIYRCVLSGFTGCPTLNSDAVTMVVNGVPGITVDPAAAIILHGANASYSVTATGFGTLSYRWQEDAGAGFVNLNNGGVYSNVTTATLTITAAPISMNGYRYRCVVTNTCGDQPSNDALLTVNKLTQTISFAAQTNGSTVTATYGDPAVNGAATASSSLALTYASDNATVASVNTAGQVTIAGAGSATITVSQGGDAVYQPATAISFTLQVNKKAISITVDPKSKTYGDVDPALTYAFTPALVGSDAFTGNISRVAGENAGTYAIQQSTLTAGNNYTLTYNSNDLVIGKKALTATADDKLRAYGAPNPAFTITYSGFAFADNAASLTTGPVGATAAGPTSIPGDYPITLSGGTSGNYTFTLVPGQITIQAVQVQFTQHPAPAEICAGERTSFNVGATATPAAAPVAYQWQYSADGIAWQDVPSAYSVAWNSRPNTGSGFVRCKISVPGADHFSQMVALTVNPLPLITANTTNDIDCAASSARLLSTGGVSYQWSPASGLDNSSIPNPVATPSRSTTYVVTGKDANGCVNSARVAIVVTPGEYNVPNAFTPDNDGKNDCWSVKFWQKTTEFSVTVLNRWGVRIFHSTDVSKCWDGSYNGEQQPTGSYVYYIRAITPCGVIERKGSVMLIR